MGSKKCSRCREKKNLTEFSVAASSKDGHRSNCKKCVSLYMREYNARKSVKLKNKEWMREYSRRPEVKKRVKGYLSKYNLNPDVKKRKRQTAHRRYHNPVSKERILENQRRYRNKPEVKLKKQIWAQNYRQLPEVKEHARVRARAYYKKNRAAFLAKDSRRRALMRNAEGSFTDKEWETLCMAYDYKCLCCKESKPLTVDHIIPLSKGGTNFISNIQPLCLSCNDKKGVSKTDYRVWMAEQGAPLDENWRPINAPG